MIPELLKTKMYIAPPSTAVVHRSRLFDLLNECSRKRLTLICAPAGFGKSTLLCEWIHGQTGDSCAADHAWLSLDEGDSDITRFLTYCITSLQAVSEELGRGILSSLQNPGEPDIENLLIILINEITELTGDVVFILDDYHLIESQTVDKAVSFLLEHLPRQLHIVISSRINPSLNLSRLRSRGQMTEIRARDLRFSFRETGDFLAKSMKISLTDDQIKALETRTEGWIAGLQFAVLSMRGSDDPRNFVRSFTGSNRYILDYLGEEILSQQSGDIQDFLLKSSVLARMTGTLCNALTGRSDGEEMLEFLENRNLFIIPLDSERCWYRYHHLFSDLLTRRLRQFNPGLVSELHHRAGSWYFEEGAYREAFRHFLDAGDSEKAADILESKWYVFVHRGQNGQLREMIDSLDSEIVRHSAPLSIACCWLCCFSEQFDLLPPYLEDIYRVMKGTTENASDLVPMKLAVIPSLAETMEAVVSFENGKKPEDAKKHALKAISLIPEAAVPPVRGLLYASAGYWLALAYEDLGEFDKACAIHMEMIELMKTIENQMGAANSLLEISRIYMKQGRIKALTELCEDMLDYIFERGWDRLPPTGVTLLVLARALRAAGISEKAEQYYKSGRDLIRPIMGPRFKELLPIEDEDKKEMQDTDSGSFFIEPLSHRELEILQFIARGLSNNEICDRLFLALSTVKGHNRHIFDKLQVKRRTEAVVRARELGLIR